MLIRVRTELGIFRAKDLDEAVAQTSLQRALRREQPSLFQNDQSVALYLDPKGEQEEVTSDKTLVEQGVTHGTMLYAHTTWQCAMCTLINRGKKTQESLCEACGEAPSWGKTGVENTDTTPVVAAAAKKRDLPEEQGENQYSSGNEKPRRLFGGRYIWEGPDSGETLNQFLENTRPSQTSTSECAWIQVHNQVRNSPGYEDPLAAAGLSMEETPKYRAALAKVERIIARTNRVFASDKATCVAEILNTAVARGETTGKWMLFANRETVDDTWEEIARATVAGKLGCSAKVSTSQTSGDGRALICIYVEDFSNKKEVKRVLQGIIALGFFVSKGFKPDIFTTLGIYGGNKWRLQTSIYKPKDVLDNWDV